VREYAAAFGVPNGSTVRRVDSSALGDGAHRPLPAGVRWRPVLGGELRVTVDAHGQVVAAAPRR
jgi:hypothetical protein